MPKRVRTNQRLDQFYGLALTGHQHAWTMHKLSAELEILIDQNYDLEAAKAKATARAEFWVMADPCLNGWLPAIRELAEEKRDLQPVGARVRLNHEMIKFCRRAGKHINGPGVAIREIKAAL